MMGRNIVRWSKITKSSPDDQQRPSQQMEYLGKVGDGIIVFPYGLHANVPPDILTLMFAIEGHSENRAAIPFNTTKRPKLAAGEVAFFHPLLPDMLIKLQANGKMLIKSGVSVDVDAPEATFSGNVTIAGDLQVAGDFNVDGTATLGGSGGAAIARTGDAVSGGVITGGSATHKAT